MSDLDQVSRRIPGSYHLIAAVGSRLRIQGTISEVRRVYAAAINGTTVAADRADVVADIGGHKIDERQLVMRLVVPDLPQAARGRSLWSGVTAVPGDCYLHIDHNGRGGTTRWWQAPEPSVPVAEAAPLLREELISAVAARTSVASGHRKRLSADLSGGMDSTSLCFLASRDTPGLLTVTFPSLDQANDDETWADRAAARLVGIERVGIDPELLGYHFSDIGYRGDSFDEPFAELRSYGHFRRMAELLNDYHCHAHLAGYGGDQLWLTPPAYLHHVIRRRPWTALRHLRGYRAMRGWSRRQAALALADRHSYRQWIASQADALTSPPPKSSSLADWAVPVRLPQWATARAVRLAAGQLRSDAESAEPLSPHRGQQLVVENLRLISSRVRQAGQIFGRRGVGLSAPYLDDQIIMTTLGAALHERSSPWVYKPLLIEAMRGLVPEFVLGRATKGNASIDTYDGLRRNRSLLLDLCDGSILAERGLIDAGNLKSTILAPLSIETMSALSATLACELWLRRENHELPST